MGFDWTELTYQQSRRQGPADRSLVFPLAVVFVFLVLAAQYESWSLPLAIILIVPMCLLAAIAGLWLMKMDNNIFTQIGLVVLVGLASKTQSSSSSSPSSVRTWRRSLRGHREREQTAVAADSDDVVRVHPRRGSAGSRQGCWGRNAWGAWLSGLSGMLGVTVFGIFFTPVFYSVIRWLTARSGRRRGVAGTRSVADAARAGQPRSTAMATLPTLASRIGHPCDAL